MIREALAELKVHGGKLVKCQLKVDDEGELLKVNFFGDFFLHPEEEIERLEAALTVVSLKELPHWTEELFGEDGFELVGVGPKDFRAVVEAAIGKLGL
jgi:hypothetical protein